MKTTLATLCLLGFSTIGALCDSTVDPANAFAWSGNLGPLNWRPSLAEGVLAGEYVCAGKVWVANAGWINFGDGTPANGIRYQNNDGADCGVNLLANGALRGLAWGANIGWVNFEATGNPRVDFATGIIRGHVWAPNVGWITLDDGGTHFVAVTGIAAGKDSDADGITDAWEIEQVGNILALTLDGDLDGDDIPDVDEYAADTDPQDAAAANLRITDFRLISERNLITLAWTSRLSRRYHLEWKGDLANPQWESGLGEIAPDSDTTTARTIERPAAAKHFYRIRASRPLAQ